MLRLTAAVLSACLILAGSPADARPKQAPTDSQRLTYCASDGSYRQTCGQAETRPTSHRRPHEAVIGSYSSLVEQARRYLGTNPTGKRSLWCGRFMAMIAPAAAAKVKNPDMARDWAGLSRVSPQVGAIAVLSRGKRGGHVGVVTGFDANGNPIVVSGNHNREVGEGVYPKSRVIAYVSAS